MKSLQFREDGLGIVVGRLCAPNVLQYEDLGSVKKFLLTGKVRDTEFNDVVVIGRRLSEDELEVSVMESLPCKDNDVMFGIMAGNDISKLYGICIPKYLVERIDDKYTEDGSLFHTLYVRNDTNSTSYVTVFGNFEEQVANNSYVFFLKEAPKVEKKEFGSGYAVKKITTRYMTGWQIAS